MEKVVNIRFNIEEYGIEFDFTYKNKCHIAILQLPHTPDSQHSIDGEDFNFDDDNDHAQIFAALKDYFYESFKDAECAKASALIAKTVIHVEEVGRFYVAICEDGTSNVLVEGSASSYYNVFYFDLPCFYYEYDENEGSIIENAKKIWFSSLKQDLDTELNDWNINWENEGFYTGGNYIDNQKGMAENCPDLTTSEFMVKVFTDEWENIELAMDFYESIACDCRVDAIHDALERLEILLDTKSQQEI